MDFAKEAGKSAGGELIPANTLAFAIITYRAEKITENGPYHDLELTMDEGQAFARRKVWHNMMDPERHKSEKARPWSSNSPRRLLEAGRGPRRGPTPQPTPAPQAPTGGQPAGFLPGRGPCAWRPEAAPGRCRVARPTAGRRSGPLPYRVPAALR